MPAFNTSKCKNQIYLKIKQAISNALCKYDYECTFLAAFQFYDFVYADSSRGLVDILGYFGH